MGDIVIVKVGVFTFLKSGQKLRSKCAFAMVYWLRWGFYQVYQKSEKCKNQVVWGLFTSLGGFAGDCEGGVRCDRKSEIADMRFWVRVAMVCL